MGYKFGDVIDCIKHTYIGHYIIILGTDTEKNKVLYATITSRTYKAFDGLCSFFNRFCNIGKCERKCFDRNFKEKKEIIPVDLFSVFFLDKDIYGPALTEDSMIIINKDLRTEDVEVLNRKKKSELIEDAFKLDKKDIYRLYTHTRTSKYISPYNLKIIKRSFNLVK